MKISFFLPNNCYLYYRHFFNLIAVFVVYLWSYPVLNFFYIYGSVLKFYPSDLFVSFLKAHSFSITFLMSNSVPSPSLLFILKVELAISKDFCF